jgi:hypothetical protein
MTKEGDRPYHKKAPAHAGAVRAFSVAKIISAS